ncbi:MAG: C10 family peptidase [Marinifilaceae bacterium]|jgi:hypothetical protein|nr:C10 family peptidase [Marinifilaceae bacterium]
MKRKILLCLILAICSNFIYAQIKLNKNTKENIIRDAIKNNPSIFDIKNTIKYEFLNNILIVELKPTGWIIIDPKGDKNYRIAYNYNNEWNIDLKDKNQTDWLKLFDHPVIEKTTKRLRGDTYNKVEPLLKTKWNQYCMPTDKWGGKPTPVSGCVQTAMAQIMKHFEYPKHGYGKVVNPNKYGGVNTNADLSDEFNYADMPLNSSCTESKKELMFELGVMSQAFYGTAEDGGTGADTRKGTDGMTKYLNYTKTSIGSLNDANRHDRVMEHLLNNIPLIVDGSNGSSGHAFILDGYDGKGNYHFNLGWGGYSNAYYSLDKIPFNKGMRIFYNLKPDKDAIKTFPYSANFENMPEWSKPKNVKIEKDENGDKVLVLKTTEDDYQLLYIAPKDASNLSLAMNLGVDTKNAKSGEYISLSVKLFDYHNNKVTDKTIYHLTSLVGQNDFRNKRIIIPLNEYRGHKLKIMIDTYTGFANAPKYQIKSFQISNISDNKIIAANCTNNRIELSYKSNIKNTDIDPSYFKIKHGEFYYNAKNVELKNNDSKSKVLYLYSNYSIKKDDKLSVSYNPKSSKSTLIDEYGNPMTTNDNNHNIKNLSTKINNKPELVLVKNDNKNALYKLKLIDKDGDVLRAQLYYDKNKITVKNGANNSYYIHGEANKIKGSYIYALMEDFSSKTHNTTFTFTDNMKPVNPNDNNNDKPDNTDNNKPDNNDKPDNTDNNKPDNNDKPDNTDNNKPDDNNPNKPVDQNKDDKDEDPLSIEKNKKAEIIIYPNPAQDFIRFNENCDLIKAYKLSGKEVLSISKYKKNNSINISKLKTGIYIVVIEQNKIKTSLKLFKK